MKNLIAITIATAVAACGGSSATGIGGQKGSVDFYAAVPFDQVSGLTIDAFTDATGTTRVTQAPWFDGTNAYVVPICTLPLAASPVQCFDPGVAVVAAVSPTNTAVGTTVFTLNSVAGFQVGRKVTFGPGTANSETLVISAVDTTAKTITTSTASAKTHGDALPALPGFTVLQAQVAPKAYSLTFNLPAGTYYFTTTYKTGATVVGTSSLQPLVVDATKANSLAISAATVHVVAPGPVMSTPTATPSKFIGFGGQTTLSVTDLSGGSTLTWVFKNAGGTACAATTDTLLGPTVVLTASAATAETCTGTVTASASGLTAKASVAVTVANDINVAINGSSPVIKSVKITTTNAADSACTLSDAAGWSCGIGFSLATAALNPTNIFAPQAHWMNVAVTYDLGASGFNPASPPAVSAIVSCPNDLIDFPGSVSSNALADVKGKGVSFNPGALASPGNIVADSYFLEPSFTLGKGAWNATTTYVAADLVTAYGNVYQSVAGGVDLDPAEHATAWTVVDPATLTTTNYKANYTTVGQCEILVKVTNQGGSDTTAGYVWFQ